MASYRPYPCEICYQSFTRSENLERHKQSRHGGAIRKPYECHQCHARFSRRDVCKRHMERCRSTGQPQQDQDVNEWSAQQESDALEILASFIPPADLSFSPNPILEDAQAVQAIQQASPASPLNTDAKKAYTKTFFEHFHPSLPILHRPTFMLASTPTLLSNITAIIGSLHSSQDCEKEEQIACATWRKACWEQGHDELIRMDRKEVCKPWVIQAWILHIIYGAYLGDGLHFESTKQMMRLLVDAVRDAGLLRQSTCFPTATSWIAQSKQGPLRRDAQPLHECWMSYINEESMKLSLFTLFFLDIQISAPCNLRPLLSPIEFGWELPFSSSLWEAPNPHGWLQRLAAEYLGPNTLGPHGELHLDRGPATSSLWLATQDIMTDSPSETLMKALQACPMASLCVVTNLDQLVRDFTRCYYQLPPNLSDPSAFHILTQSQNRQIMAAVRLISRTVDQTGMSSHRALWETVQLLTASVKVSLCLPDELLVGGVVDGSIVAGLATAMHLTLGNYVAVRRSAPLRLQQKSKDDGALSIVGDLLHTFSGIVESNGPTEAPWTTVSTLRMLLMLWQVLRRANTEIRTAIQANGSPPRRFEPSMLIFHALMEALVGCAGDPEFAERYARAGNETDLSSLLDDSESVFVRMLMKVCQARPVWGIGAAMESLVEGITDGAPLA